MLIFLQTRIQILIRNCHFTFIQQIIFNCADTCLRLGICGLLFEYLPYICNQILFRGDLLLGKCICYHVIGQRVHGNRLINSLDFEFKRCFLSRQIRRLVILRECHIRTYFIPDFCADKPITESINIICLLCGITVVRHINHCVCRRTAIKCIPVEISGIIHLDIIILLNRITVFYLNSGDSVIRKQRH